MRKRNTFLLGFSVCTLAILLSLWVKALQDRGSSVSCGVIGTADGPTAILMSGQISDPLLYGTGAALLFFSAAVIFLLRLRARHKM